MVIESLKAVQTALKETMKDKNLSDASRKQLEESDARLQKLIEEAREAAKAAEAAKQKEEKAKEAAKAKKKEDGMHDEPMGEEADDDEDEDEDEEKKKKSKESESSKEA